MTDDLVHVFPVYGTNPKGLQMISTEPPTTPSDGDATPRERLTKRDFIEFPKIARLSRGCTVTEKIDGTNASILIDEDGSFLCGSRTRWITPQDDNFGFAAWAHANRDELMTLGPGHHFGEWWGAGIQRRYGQDRKRWSLFNTAKWSDVAVRPACCDVVPVLYGGVFNEADVIYALEKLRAGGSVAAPGFNKPEGVIVWHEAARMYFKKTLDKDEEWKGKSALTRGLVGDSTVAPPDSAGSDNP